MEKAFWLNRWENRQIGFHQEQVNEYLLRHWDKFHLPEQGRVFVPLCGKSTDLVWLADKGYDVTGVEYSQIAVEEFFQEHNLTYELTVKDQFNIYHSDNITIFQGDYFDLNKDMLGRVEFVFDRASLVALPDDMRSRYAEHMYRLTEQTDMLLVTMEYDQAQMQGPPFAVTVDEVQQHFSSLYNVSELETQDLLSTSPQFKERGLDSLFEKVYKLSAIDPS